MDLLLLLILTCKCCNALTVLLFVHLCCRSGARMPVQCTTPPPTTTWWRASAGLCRTPCPPLSSARWRRCVTDYHSKDTPAYLYCIPLLHTLSAYLCHTCVSCGRGECRGTAHDDLLTMVLHSSRSLASLTDSRGFILSTQSYSHLFFCRLRIYSLYVRFLALWSWPQITFRYHLSFHCNGCQLVLTRSYCLFFYYPLLCIYFISVVFVIFDEELCLISLPSFCNAR